MEIAVNWLAVILSAVVSMVVGFLWYGPVLGKQWMREKGYTKASLEKAQKEMGKLYGLSFVLAIVTAFVLNNMIGVSQAFYGYPRLSTGMITAFWMWVGFILPVQTTATIFGEKNWKLLGIDTGYQFASVMVMGVVLGLL